MTWERPLSPHEQRIRHAAMRPELYETWQIANLASDASFCALWEEEALLRETLKRREPPPRPAFLVVGELTLTPEEPTT